MLIAPGEGNPSPEVSRAMAFVTSRKFLLLAGLGLILLLGGGALYLLLSDDPEEASPARAAEVQPAPGAVLALEPFLVNLADPETRRYLKIKVELEVDQAKSLKELEKSLPRLRDALILLLGSKTYKEVASPEGKLRLKEEMLARLSQIPGGKKIRQVFFTEFVAQ